jgi:peptidoglycan/LPS O-acetylase OafA/YrhL
LHPSERIPALDAVRAIGAIAVLGTHVAFFTGAAATTTVGGVLARLDVGVAIFFALSGFLLFRPFALAAATARARPSVPRYLWRRALRILPAYWLAVVACLLVLPWLAKGSTPGGGEWLRNLTLTQIYAPGWNRAGLSQTWSLATEAVFYLLLPVLAILSLGRHWRPLRVALVNAIIGVGVSAGWLIGLYRGVLDPFLHTTWYPMYAVWFAVGMALATAHVALATGSAPSSWRLMNDIGSAPGACLAAALGLLVVAGTPLTGPRDLSPVSTSEFAARLVLFALIAGLVLVPAAFGPPNRFKHVLGGASFRWFGEVSYGLFLWHLLVLEGIYLIDRRPMFTGDLLETFLLTLGGGLVLAGLSYYLLERPAQRWGARRAYRRRSADDGQPQDGDHDEPGELRPDRPVGVGLVQRQPAAGEQGHRREVGLDAVG